MTPEYTKEQAAALLAALTAPFSLKDVKWRVVSKSKDGKKGMVAAYADPRVYALRLNEVLTPLGWTCDYTTTTMNGITRQMRNGPAYQTGKIAIVATVELAGITRKASTGECWADDENGMTRAESQAFKRACALFGLGKYLYDLKDFYDTVDVKAYPDFNHWVPLNEYGQPTRLPKLPRWAVPVQPAAPASAAPAAAAKQEAKSAPVAPTPAARTQPLQKPAGESKPQPVVTSTASTPNGSKRANNVSVIPPNHEAAFNVAQEQMIDILGMALFKDIMQKVDDLAHTGVLKGNLYEFALRKLGAAADLMHALQEEAQTSIGSAKFRRLGISVAAIVTHRQLMEVADQVGLLKAA